MGESKPLASPEIITFGCRLNTYESEVMRGHAISAGMTNAVIINSCAVTKEAERQARQAVRRAKRENPDARIIVTGCNSPKCQRWIRSSAIWKSWNQRLSI